MLGEFELIERYFTRQCPSSSALVLGIGDDAAAIAAISAGECSVISVDTLVSGRHFFADDPPESIAHKALMVNLSDLNAMGARPVSFLLALVLPNIDEAWLQRFSDTLNQEAARWHVSLIGGDTTQGPLTISITALGTAKSTQLLKRSQARVGDAIYFTGQLGAAGYYLYARENHWPCRAEAQRAYEYPQPPLLLGPQLAGVAHAAIDISDGFCADLNHILQASQVGANLDAHAFAIYPEWAEAVARGDLFQDKAFQLALSCGDDYQLCFTAPDDKAADIAQCATQIGISLACVGRIEALPGIRLDKKPLSFSSYGWQHFDEISYKLAR